MTIHIGFWVVPLIITVALSLPVAFYRKNNDYDPGGAILAALWLIGTLVAWAMWGLSWLM